MACGLDRAIGLAGGGFAGDLERPGLADDGDDLFELARAADYHFDLPLNVAPGDYLLRLDATASNATATRGVRFSVR